MQIDHAELNATLECAEKGNPEPLAKFMRQLLAGEAVHGLGITMLSIVSEIEVGRREGEPLSAPNKAKLQALLDEFNGSIDELMDIISARFERQAKELIHLRKASVAAELVILRLAKMRHFFGNHAREIVVERFLTLNRNEGAIIEVRDLTNGVEWIRRFGSPASRNALNGEGETHAQNP